MKSKIIFTFLVILGMIYLVVAEPIDKEATQELQAELIEKFINTNFLNIVDKLKEENCLRIYTDNIVVKQESDYKIINGEVRLGLFKKQNESC